MKKILMVLAATLICGACLLTSCKKDDTLNVAETIVARWIVADTDGQPAATNEKIVFDIVSTTEAYVSLSIQDRTAEDTPWSDREEIDVEINGNDVILSHSPKPGMTVVVGLHIESITDATLTAKRTVTIRQDGGLVKSSENKVRYEKMNVNYRNAICGYWIGRMTSAESEYGDIGNHGWEFNDDGTFVYFTPNALDNEMIESEDEYADYFVAGNLLCTRWKNVGEGQEEHREWWEITINGDVMNWTALRKRADGTTYTATYEMEKWK